MIPWGCQRSMALLAVLILASPSAAGETIAAGTQVFDGSRVAPGSTIAIQAGTWSLLKISNLTGTREKPIVIANEGGLVRLANADRGFAIALHGCRHVRLTGSGTPGLQYGIQAEATKAGMFTIHVVDRSSDIEIDHVEITGAGFSGFNVKDDPRPDGSVNRGAFVMENIHLHHNYIHDVPAEAFYVGHSFYQGIAKPGGGLLLPHVIKGVRIHHNRTVNTGFEAIQIGCATDVEVHDNVIERSGTRGVENQNNGMQINAFGSVQVYRNTFREVSGFAMILSSLEDDYSLVLHQNLLVHAGAGGVFIGGTKGAAGKGIGVYNNTVVDCGGNAFRVFNNALPSRTFMNNLMVANKEPAIAIVGGGGQDGAANVELASVEKAGFRDPAAGDYDLLPMSPAVGKGKVVPGLAPSTDLAGRDLSRASVIDVGAYAPSAPTLETAKPGKEKRNALHALPPAKDPDLTPEGWGRILDPALTAAMARKLRIRFSSSLLGGAEVELAGYQAGRLLLASDGNMVPFPLARVQQDDIISLVCATADAMRDQAAVRALAAKMLTTAGRQVEAGKYLLP